MLIANLVNLRSVSCHQRTENPRVGTLGGRQRDCRFDSVPGHFQHFYTNLILLVADSQRSDCVKFA
jgi:hypothetical protein